MQGPSRKLHVAAGRWLTLVAAGALSWLAAGCALNPATGKKEFTLVTPAQESAMGREGYGAAIAEFGLYDDNALDVELEVAGEPVRVIVTHLGLWPAERRYQVKKILEMIRASKRPAATWTFLLDPSMVRVLRERPIESRLTRPY